MSQKPLLVLDAHYLCHRAFWSQKDLSWRGVPTGVIFGFLKSISVLKEKFMTDQIAFCFEGPESLRRKIFPAYKQKRELAKMEPEVKTARGELCRQIDKLREDYLPTAGFHNVFCYPGYESDDIMAQIARTGPDLGYDWIILVTSDRDLYQCVSPHTALYDPHKQELMTETRFRKLYSIKPRQWAVVKALSGCSTDGVPGIGGCGEKTALKMIKTHPKLSQKQRAAVHRNRKLVELPFSGCPVPEIKPDHFDRTGWDIICGNLGMKSLIGRYPLYQSQMTLF